MMGGGALLPLNLGGLTPENRREAEIRLAVFFQILLIAAAGALGGLPALNLQQAAETEKADWGYVRAEFRVVWLICQHRRFCYPSHSIGSETGAVSCKGSWGSSHLNIGFSNLYSIIL
jgi:hypothetical protein